MEDLQLIRHNHKQDFASELFLDYSNDLEFWGAGIYDRTNNFYEEKFPILKKCFDSSAFSGLLKRGDIVYFNYDFFQHEENKVEDLDHLKFYCGAIFFYDGISIIPPFNVNSIYKCNLPEGSIMPEGHVFGMTTVIGGHTNAEPSAFGYVPLDFCLFDPIKENMFPSNYWKYAFGEDSHRITTQYLSNDGIQEKIYCSERGRHIWADLQLFSSEIMQNMQNFYIAGKGLGFLSFFHKNGVRYSVGSVFGDKSDILTPEKFYKKLLYFKDPSRHEKARARDKYSKLFCFIDEEIFENNSCNEIKAFFSQNNLSLSRHLECCSPQKKMNLDEPKNDSHSYDDFEATFENYHRWESLKNIVDFEPMYREIIKNAYHVLIDQRVAFLSHFTQNGTHYAIGTCLSHYYNRRSDFGIGRFKQKIDKKDYFMIIEKGRGFAFASDVHLDSDICIASQKVDIFLQRHGIGRDKYFEIII